MGPLPACHRDIGLFLLVLGWRTLKLPSPPEPERSGGVACAEAFLALASSFSLSNTSITPFPNVATNVFTDPGSHLMSVTRELLRVPEPLNLPLCENVMASMSRISPDSKPTSVSRFSADDVPALMAQHVGSEENRFSLGGASWSSAFTLHTQRQSLEGYTKKSTPCPVAAAGGGCTGTGTGFLVKPSLLFAFGDGLVIRTEFTLA
mmetsp:Transcript_5867/g.11623  ORF Transcript_5867/g.11623 Transcript_5867/m.11623 type:complete len:206 (+) Transcript_5867:660-1277(+)